MYASSPLQHEGLRRTFVGPPSAKGKGGLLDQKLRRRQQSANQAQSAHYIQGSPYTSVVLVPELPRVSPQEPQPAM